MNNIQSYTKEELKRVQWARLMRTLIHFEKNVPFFKEHLKEHGVSLEDIKTFDDFKRIPFMKKQMFRDQYPFGLFAVPKKEIVRVHASSGTTGKPTVVGYTRDDIEIFAELVARSLMCAGVTSDDVIQVAYGYGLFTGGLGIHYGAERLGATVIPASGGNTQKQILLMKDLGTTVLACTPSYALYMAEEMESMGIDPSELSLKIGIFGAEPWTDSLRQEIEKKLNIKAFDIYGLSEAIGPGVAMECSEKNGLHIFEDHFYPEIINPKTGEVLPEGELGELVLTSLTKECSPIVRYRTGDMTRISYEDCPCGCTYARIEKPLGRSDDMIIIRGVNVFPTQVESVLLSMGVAEPHYQLVVSRTNNLDELEIKIELSESLDQQEQQHSFKQQLASVLGIHAKLTFSPPKSLPRFEGKAVRVIDQRK